MNNKKAVKCSLPNCDYCKSNNQDDSSSLMLLYYSKYSILNNKNNCPCGKTHSNGSCFVKNINPLV
jgi:hypothetical protein